jgi:hypothetical protein
MTISEQIDHKIHTELLSYAVSCARSRRFMNRDSVSMTMTKEKEYLARRSLWYLYSMEVVHSIRDGMPPVSSGCATLFVRTPLTVRNRSSPPTGPTMRYPKSARIPIGCSSNVNMLTLSAQRSIRSTVQGLFAKLWPSENEI